ncbi:MAG: hypothetical protein JW955_03745 [Sedimentisphaerales bacterium]|nr:hypothetical protein [Sedimentisphaerales bacterium]
MAANGGRTNDTDVSVGNAKRLSMLLGAGVIVVLCFATRFSPAQTAMEVTRWREYSSTKRSSQVSGKMAGLNAVDRTGFIVLGDGGFAQLSSSMVHADSPEGKLFCQGFTMYDFPDGSSILAKVDVSGEYRGKQTGIITFVSGTGRFKGITGRGTISAWLPKDWDMYAEVEASFSATGR